jgi:hypothetical protein
MKGGFIMPLKAATLAAVVGAALMTITRIFYTMVNFGIIKYSPFVIPIQRIVSLLSFITPVTFIFFFAMLYSNQVKARR